MKRFFLSLWAIALILGLVKISGAEVIDFESLYTGSQTIDLLPDGYAGFNWSSDAWWITNKYDPGSGFDFGTIGNVSLITGWEEDISMNHEYFNFHGAYITAAWNTGQDATVEGWRDGALAYSKTIMTSYDGPHWFSFDYPGIDTLWFKPGDLGTDAGLTKDFDYHASGHHLAIDNILVTYQPSGQAAPLPSTCLLFLSGLIGMAGIKRKFA
jgi:hypothetical protein